MKVKYIGESNPLELINGKEYEVISVEKGPGNEDWYRVKDETGEDYLYHHKNFKTVKE